MAARSRPLVLIPVRLRAACASDTTDPGFIAGLGAAAWWRTRARWPEPEIQ